MRSAGAHVLIQYEFPFNERIRTLLRLEDLATRFSYFQQQDDAYDHQASLTVLFEILEVAARADLKSDLLQELERQRQTLTGQREREEPLQLDPADVEQLLHEIDVRYQALAKTSGRTGQHLRENEWLMGLRARMVMPGGACQFDVPSFHAWMHRQSADRQTDLLGWTAPFMPLLDAVALVMRLLRARGTPSEQKAQRGSFQLMLSGKQYLMARVKIDSGYNAIPEVSANKYAISVRFLVQDGTMRPRAHDIDIPFELTLSSL